MPTVQRFEEMEQSINGFDVGFAMGLLVGEGSFTHDNKGPEIAVNLHHGDRAPLEKLASLLGGKVYGPYDHGRGPYFRYVLSGPGMLRALPVIDRYLPNSKKRGQYEEWRLQHEIQIVR